MLESKKSAGSNARIEIAGIKQYEGFTTKTKTDYP
jgi:hypothetical protein